MGFESILNYLPKPTSPKVDNYLGTDLAYTFWYFGISCGDLLCVYLQKQEKIKDEIEQLGQLYIRLRKIGTNYFFPNEEGDTVLKILKELSGEITNYEIFRDQLMKLSRDITLAIRLNSHHLSVIYQFGFNINLLKADLLNPIQNRVRVVESVERLENTVLDLKEGDKDLQSVNLEISDLNLRILNVSLRYLKKKVIKKTISLNPENYSDYAKMINKVFGIHTDILLDVRNPAQFIRNNVLLFVVVYYYLAVAFLFLVDLFVKLDFRQNLSRLMSINIDSARFKLIMFIFIIPLIYLGYYFIKRVHNIFTQLLINIKLRSLLRGFFKQQQV